MTRTPRVWNKHDRNTPADAVYIGRPSKWGNPFTHIATHRTLARFVVETREKAVESYVEWIIEQTETGQLDPKELRGKDLVCWCKPAACHGDILLELANATD